MSAQKKLLPRIVVKVGGEILESPDRLGDLVEDINALRVSGVAPVLCHGGGPQISRLTKQLGGEPRFVNGQRVTDAAGIEIAAMVLLGALNARIVARFNTSGACAVGLSGADARLFVVEQEKPEMGFVGRIRSINTNFVDQLLDAGYVPVVAPLGIDDAGALFNINADIAAGALAGALRAQSFVVLTNVAGLYESFGKPESLLREVSAEKVRGMLQGGTIHEGMLPKLQGVLAALDAGVEDACMLDGRVKNALAAGMRAPREHGTLVRR